MCPAWPRPALSPADGGLGRAADGAVWFGGRVLVPARAPGGEDAAAAAGPAAAHRRGHAAVPGAARGGPHGADRRERAEVGATSRPLRNRC